jgi:hypothetical protein
MNDVVCSVCGEVIGEKMGAVCNTCSQPFHMNQRNDVPGKDCGTVWINEQFLALEFACQRCLDEVSPPRRADERPVVPREGRRRYRKRS